MHYTLDQCKDLAEKLLAPIQDQRAFLAVNLHHEMPWPSDDQITATFLELKSKKQAAARLGITRQCLRRRLQEIKLGGSMPQLTPVSVRLVLQRLKNGQTLQQISAETEVHQAWLCRLLANLHVAYMQRYDVADVKPRTTRPANRISSVFTEWRHATGAVTNNVWTQTTSNEYNCSWDFTVTPASVYSTHANSTQEANAAETGPPDETVIA